MSLKTSINFEIAVLCGSVRQGRKSPAVAKYLANALAKQNGIKINYIDLAEFDLPIMQERRGHHPNLPAAAEKLGVQLENADAILVVSPEYNGSYPGVLKNTLDYYYDELAKKPVGIVSVSSGRLAGANVMQMLQLLFLRVGSFVCPAKMQVAEVGKVFDEHEKTDNEFFIKSSAKFIEEFRWFIEAILAKKQA
jgi:azobenzene reductase